MNSDNEQLGRAFANVGIIQVASALGIELRIGVQKSPFREDKNGKSFSVTRGAKGEFFKDHAIPEHKGGAWAFVKLAQPGWSNKEIADFLIRQNGEEPERWSPGAMKKAVEVKRSELYAKKKADLVALPRLSMDEPDEWSTAVWTRYSTGLDLLREGPGAIALARGWDDSIVLALAEAGKMSRPFLPWASAERKVKGYAFVVEKPVAVKGSAGRALELVPVGYHQRFVSVRGEDQVKSKNWCFVPYVPQADKAKTKFQKRLLAEGRRVPAYPFVLGDLVRPRLVVMLEGQWDAISFAAAFGWLENGFPTGVAVFGLRGVQSQEVVLAAYGAWLKCNAPFVWVLGDSDEAGAAVVARKDETKICSEPSFVDRLRALGCRVKVQFLNVKGCKDFNDVYQALNPSVADMADLAEKAGAGEFVGGK